MAVVNDVGDKFLWSAVLVAGIAAYWYIPHFLTYAKELAAVPPRPIEGAKPQLQKAAEDAIGTSTLAELADGPSYNLSASAIRLTAARVVKTDVRFRLLDDLRSKSWERRNRAITGLSLLIFDPTLKEGNIRRQFINESTFEAIVEALLNIKEENKHRYNVSNAGLPPSPVRPAYRPVHERILMELLINLIENPRYRGRGEPYFPYNIQSILKTGLITQWLAHYPFPCAQPENAIFNYKKSDVCELLSEDDWGEDDIRMSRLVGKLQRLPGGLKQLADASLRTPSHDDEVQTTLQLRPISHPRRPQNTFGLNDLDDEDEEGEIGRLIDDEDLMHRLRENTAPRNSAEQTPEERSLRRRHRNAVVVAEPGSPLRPENILQRQLTDSELDQPADLDSQTGDSISVMRLMAGRSLDEIDGLASDGFGPGTALPPDLVFVPLEGADETFDDAEDHVPGFR